MTPTLSRSLLALGATLSLAACGGSDRLNNATNNTKNNNTGTLSIDSFTASAASVASGGSVTLSWAVSGADAVSVTINRQPGTPVIEGATNATGSVDSGPITEQTTFTLTVTGGGASKSSTPVTVSVDASAVQIVSFTATPNPAPAGGMVTLAWQTAGATKVVLLEGTTELFQDTAAQGSFQVTLSEAVHTYTLRAENDVMSTSEMVTVTTETPPSITTFAVSPNTFTGASGDVTVTFAGMGETFELTANGAAVAGYGGEAAGNLTVTVTETTLFVFTARGAGQTVSAMGAVAQAIAEVEPNNDKTTATPITGGATGAVDPEGDVDFFSFTVPAGGNVFAQPSDGMGGCPFPALLSLYDDVDTDPLTDTFFGTGDCPAIDPMFDPAAADLPGGTYYISVEAVEGMGAYSLVVLVGNAACGNGLLELSTNEQCDDGNTADNDGCSSTCQVEPLGTVSGIGQEQTFSGALVPATAAHFYEVTLPSEGYIVAETGVPTIGSCADPADTIVSLLDSSFELLDENDDANFEVLCSALTPVPGQTYAAGTYYVRVETYPGTPELAAYQVRIQTLPLGCGNGVAETGEQCDDGNTADNDGCSSTCTIEAAGNITGAGGTVSVTVGAPTDFPRFVNVTVTGGQSITATTTGPGGAACPFGTALGLFDATATAQYGIVDGAGGCAFIDPAVHSWATDLAAGTYLLGVVATEGTGGAVDVTVTLSDAVCGNGNVENNANEQCDDGNTMNGDGCDSSCMFEGNITMEVEPNDSTATATALTIAPGGAAQTITGGVTPVGDLDYFSFTIASGTASLVAQTYPVFGDPTSCDFDMDTLLELTDSMGNVLATNDDDDDRTGFCSLLNSTTDMAAGNLAAGTYYVVVRHYNNTVAFPSYFMDVSLTTP